MTQSSEYSLIVNEVWPYCVEYVIFCHYQKTSLSLYALVCGACIFFCYVVYNNKKKCSFLDIDLVHSSKMIFLQREVLLNAPTFSKKMITQDKRRYLSNKKLQWEYYIMREPCCERDRKE